MIEVDFDLIDRNFQTVSNSKDFLILNNSNAFYSNLEEGSRYQGFFVPFGSSMLKLIHKIHPSEDFAIKRINHLGYKVIIEKKNSTESFFVPEKSSSLVYSNSQANSQITLDIKNIFDNRVFGRFYNISSQKGKTIIFFKKLTAKADNDAGDDELEYQCYLVINSEFSDGKKWQNFKFNYDQSRNSMPFERYMLVLGTFPLKEIVITFGKDLNKAILENDYISKNIMKLEKNSQNTIKSIKKEYSTDNKLNMAYNLSQLYLNLLSCDKGITAGLPWFFQPWTRDELISLKSSMQIKGIDYGKRRLFYLIKEISIDGRLASIRKSDFFCIDSIGWLFRLSYLFLTVYKTELTKEEMLSLKGILQKFGDKFIVSHLKNSLISNGPKETWMDSLAREGPRIEVQALLLNILEVMKLITKDTKYLKLQQDIYDNIKKVFFDGNSLFDGSEDKTIRNNVFLAYYLDKRILKTDEWEIVFKNSLEKLWLDWGGIATIDKTNLAFIPSHTGEIPSSYHNGDSWFFMNHIAAIAMIKLNKTLFAPYIKKIINASIQSMLEKGCLGCLSELSSASTLLAQGCPLQAWSLATFIEMMDFAKSEKVL